MATVNQVAYLSCFLKALPKRKDIDLTDDERETAAKAAAAELQALVDAGCSSPWFPINYPQALMYVNTADEIYYGGSSGGGKSMGILGLATTAHSRALILRKEATQLKQMKDDIIKLLQPGDNFRHSGHGCLLDTIDGRQIEMSGCANRLDAEKFRGRAHDLKAWDEITQFPEEVYRFVNAWLRTDDPGQRCRVIAAGNPPSRPEEEWVIRYWGPWLDPKYPNPAEPGEVRWFAGIDGKDVEVSDGQPFLHKGESITPRSRTFIPARLSDNPLLEKTGYRSTLQALPEPLRSQLLFGDMTAGRKDDDQQLLPTSWVKESMRAWRDVKGDRDEQGLPKKMDAASLDCAMLGSDSLCLAKIYDNWIAPLALKPGSQVSSGQEMVSFFLANNDGQLHMPLVIDMLANAGGTALQAFRTELPKLTVFACNSGLRTSTYRDRSGKLEMVNIRAEAYWRLREWLDPSLAHEKPRLLLPDDDDLLAELTAITWKPVSGKVQIADKETVIKPKLSGRSPDRADAISMLTLATVRLGNRWISEEQKRSEEGPDQLSPLDIIGGKPVNKPQDIGQYRVADKKPVEGAARWIV